MAPDHLVRRHYIYLIGRVSVPDYCWKVLFVKATGETEADSFKNDDLPTQVLESYRVTVDSIFNLSGIHSETN